MEGPNSRPDPSVRRPDCHFPAFGEELMDGRADYLLRLGDDALILGQRLSEWCGHAPALEVDLSLANIALDLIGQRSSAMFSISGTACWSSSRTAISHEPLRGSFSIRPGSIRSCSG